MQESTFYLLWVCLWYWRNQRDTLKCVSWTTTCCRGIGCPRFSYPHYFRVTWWCLAYWTCVLYNWNEEIAPHYILFIRLEHVIWSMGALNFSAKAKNLCVYVCVRVCVCVLWFIREILSTMYGWDSLCWILSEHSSLPPCLSLTTSII